jgi:hypothetical protein
MLTAIVVVAIIVILGSLSIDNNLLKFTFIFASFLI